MKVHKDFKKFCEDIQAKNKDLTLIRITSLITKHNTINMIKEEIINYER